MKIDNPPESATYQEISSQTEAWAEAIAVVEAQRASLTDLWANGNFSRIIFAGCGSTYYLSLAAAALFQVLVCSPAQAVPGGELWLNPDSIYQPDEKILLIAVSRSGSTTETIEAVKQFQHKTPGKVVVISNHPDSPLAGMGDIALGIPKGQERSIAQTRSFASMYVAATAMAVLLASRDDLLEEMKRLPYLGSKLIGNFKNHARAIGEDLSLDRIYFLGSGARYGLACEINLKMKEMTLTVSEPFHFLEFRHGPMSMVTDSTLVVGFLSESNYRHELSVLQEMRDLGASILSLGETGTDIEFKSGFTEPIRGVLYLPVMQLMAYYRAKAKNLDPDYPQNLSAVVHLTAKEETP